MRLLGHLILASGDIARAVIPIAVREVEGGDVAPLVIGVPGGAGHPGLGRIARRRVLARQQAGGRVGQVRVTPLGAGRDRPGSGRGLPGVGLERCAAHRSPGRAQSRRARSVRPTARPGLPLSSVEGACRVVVPPARVRIGRVVGLLGDGIHGAVVAVLVPVRLAAEALVGAVVVPRVAVQVRVPDASPHNWPDLPGNSARPRPLRHETRPRGGPTFPGPGRRTPRCSATWCSRRGDVPRRSRTPGRAVRHAGTRPRGKRCGPASGCATGRGCDPPASTRPCPARARTRWGSDRGSWRQ